ncbi:bacteriohopanetetrol glucosamine biosynthesis glycosyltransferase HpnI [Lichenicola sp.]|uniref:bacteriohopanetetrol glucosamine biosynthesis glycosyltransferase HpnI n=1 Tax=Lichenicola sp. TaxID=2804529 RepID=UPI003AFFA857
MSVVSGGIAGLGCVQAIIGAGLLSSFGRRAALPDRSGSAGGSFLPPVTVLKPLYGDEPLLEDALASFCMQVYPTLQIVFGVQSRSDPAIAVVKRLQARFPDLDLMLVVDSTPHGDNHKIDNLINMLPHALHDVLVISDSDIHAQPGYLRRVVQALHRPGVGLVTTLYGGRAASPSMSRRLAAGQLNYNFLPGVLMSRLLGRQDCLGATMALSRRMLDSIGGLPALSPHIADDSALGQMVRAEGGSIAIADVMTVTTTAETGVRDLFLHELRWARTVRSVEPLGYALSAIQFPLFWGALTVLLAEGAHWSWAVLALAWLVRGVCGALIDRMLGLPRTLPVLLLPLRDWLSAAVMAASFTGRRVAWRGQTMQLPDRVSLAQTRRELAPGVDAGA